MDHAVVIDQLVKTFRRRDGAVVNAIDHASLTIDHGEFVVLLGPSGCGKTTLLRALAGLEDPDSGSIHVGDRAVYSSAEKISLPPEARKLSMMFQSYALWPHMTAAQNVRYPLENRRSARLTRQQMKSKVEDVLRQVGVGELNDQYPSQLSGGQQQRIALARALVNDSDLVLFDEPLSNVDAKVREQLRLELLSTQRHLGFTAVFVTHDQAEAMQLATRIAVLDQGKVQQLGTPAEVYRHPATEYVARFIGNTNGFRGRRVDRTSAYSTPAGDMHVGDRPLLPATANLLWRPEDGHLSADPLPDRNSLPAQVISALYMGTHVEYLVTAGGTECRLWSNGRQEFFPGDTAWIGLSPDDVMVFDADESSATEQQHQGEKSLV